MWGWWGQRLTTGADVATGVALLTAVAFGKAVGATLGAGFAGGGKWAGRRDRSDDCRGRGGGTRRHRGIDPVQGVGLGQLTVVSFGASVDRTEPRIWLGR